MFGGGLKLQKNVAIFSNVCYIRVRNYPTTPERRYVIMKKRFMIALCCLVLLVNLLPIVPMAATVSGAEISQELYYCREQLKTMDNSAALLFAYDNLVAGIDACAEEIIISNDQYKLSSEEFEMVLEATRRDHTEQFWMGGSYTHRSSNGVLWSIQPTYTMTGADLQTARTAFNAAINTFVDALDPDMSEYEIEKALHDMLAIRVDYVSTPNAHNAYGALVEGKAVCEGYAEAFQCLLQRVGIQSVEIFGYGINPTTKQGEPHAWNAVRIDGKYYLVDTTWDDQGTLISYAYFNQTSAVLGEDHQQWRVGRRADGTDLNCEVFSLPVCTASEANYFAKEDLRISTYTIESVGELLKENNFSVSVYVESDVAAFKSWYEANISRIASKAGVSGTFTYGTTIVGREVRLFINSCTHAQCKEVAAKTPGCTENGNITYYICQNAQCGKWFTDAECKSEIFTKESVIVLSIGHDWSVKDTENENTLLSKATNCGEYDTYKYICAVCGEISDTYTFTTEAGAHVDANEDGVCDLCRDGEKPSILDSMIGGVIGDGEGAGLLDIILANPYLLGGGGGAILLVVIIVIINRIRG